LDKSEAVLLELLKNCLQEEDGSLSGGCVGFNALKRMASEFLYKKRGEQRDKYLSFLFYHFFFFAAKTGMIIIKRHQPACHRAQPVL